MTVSHQKEIQVTSRNNKRITKLGRLLRASKLDELPQLLNVLLGQMSLVGPRPEVPDYLARYNKRDQDMMTRLKPGITDLASLRFKDEEAILARYEDTQKAYFDHVVPKKMKYVRFYVTHQTLCFDMYLIVQTVKSIVIK